MKTHRWRRRSRPWAWAVVHCALLGAGPALAELTIEGVDDDVQEVLEAFVTVDDLPCDAPRWWVERRHRQAEDEVRRGMEALGYYNAGYQGALSWGEDCWHATYRVEKGEPVRVEAFDLVIEGALQQEQRMRDAVAAIDIAAGDRFSHSDYEAAKASLLETATELGYFDAEFVRHRVEVLPDRNVAYVELTLAGGARYRIGAIEVEQGALRDGFFRRFLKFQTGDWYDGALLDESFRALSRSDYYDRVLVNPDLDTLADGEVTVRVLASANTRRTALVGAGYATDTGLRARLDLRYRRVNDRGHRADFTSLVSEVNGQVGAEYIVPYGDPGEEWLFGKAELSYENTDTSESRARELSFGRTHRRGSRWVETNYLQFSRDDFEVADDQGTSELLLFGTSWTRATLAETPRPLLGYSLSLDMRGATEVILSDNDLFQVIGRARQIVPLGERFRVLGRLHAGWSWVGEFGDLPPKIRFFAGGDNSVRGYAYESLGPEEDGEVVGGQRLLSGTLEMDALVRPNWSVAAFVDTGSAFDDEPDFSTGVGLGLRWYSPLGPLRFDLAHPLDDPDNNVRVHITLGPDL